MEKTLNGVSYLGTKHSTRCGGAVWRKTCKQNSFCVGVVWQTEHSSTSGSNQENAKIKLWKLGVRFAQSEIRRICPAFQNIHLSLGVILKPYNVLYYIGHTIDHMKTWTVAWHQNYIYKVKLIFDIRLFWIYSILFRY